MAFIKKKDPNKESQNPFEKLINKTIRLKIAFIFDIKINLFDKSICLNSPLFIKRVLKAITCKIRLGE